MDVVKTIDNYAAVADFVEDGGAKALLAVMRQNLAANKYYLPFFGQFSAGKSKLINHLLGFDLLPTKSQETTAFITYISYGYSDAVTVKYSDGQTEMIGISEVRQMDYNKVGNKVAEMYITINNPLLENGLTIVDTPGVNTIIEEHVEVAEKLLENIKDEEEEFNNFAEEVKEEKINLKDLDKYSDKKIKKVWELTCYFKIYKNVNDIIDILKNHKKRKGKSNPFLFFIHLESIK